MTHLKTTIDIFKLLNKSNCRDCNEKTCLAFAASVFKGNKELNECPHLDLKTLETFGGKIEKRKTIEEEQYKIVEKLKQEISTVDLAAAAKRTGGRFSGNKLTLKIFGKDFSVYSDGRLESDLHINPWITIPLLTYIMHCRGKELANDWVPFKELKNGRERQGLFHKQCEERFKRIADTYTDLFADLIDIFNGIKVENHYQSDIALVLYPLPKVPMLLCYWKPEDDLDSEFTLFFDSTAEENSSIESIYALGTGIVQMFDKLALKHGF